MSIIYAVVARQNTPTVITLSSYDAAHGNYPTITEQILSKVKLNESASYKYNEEYSYHILKERDVLFVCLADSCLKIDTVYAFLAEVKKKFQEKYSTEEIQNAKSFDMSATFAQTFKHLFNYYNKLREEDKKQILMKQLESLQNSMSENIEKVLQREEKVELLVKKTAKMNSIADEIRTKTGKIKKQAFWQKHKWKCLIMGLLAGVAGGAIILI